MAKQATNPELGSVIFRTMSTGVVVALWPYESHGVHNQRKVQRADGLTGSTLETYSRYYGRVIKQSKPATAEEIAPLKSLMEKLGYAFNIETRRNPKHWSLRPIC